MRPSFFHHLHPPSIPVLQARFRHTLAAGGLAVFLSFVVGFHRYPGDFLLHTHAGRGGPIHPDPDLPGPVRRIDSQPAFLVGAVPGDRHCLCTWCG